MREKGSEGERARRRLERIAFNSRFLTGTTSAGVSMNASTASSKVDACSALWRARASIEGSSGGEEGRGDADGDEEDAAIDDKKRRFRARLMATAGALSLLPMLSAQQCDTANALVVRGSIMAVFSRRKETREF